MIIELSKFNSLTSFSNSDWINSFQPLTVQPGGSLSFKAGFLDYNTSSQQVIELQEDTNITIQTGFYMVCPYTESPENTTGRFGDLYVNDIETYTPFDLYVARDPSNNYNLITSSRQFTIPAGNYSPDEIAQILNYNCVNVKSNTHGSGDTFNNNATNNFFRSTLQQAYTCAMETIPASESTSEGMLIARDPASLEKFNVGDKVVFLDFDRGASQPDGLQHAYEISEINYVTGEIKTNPEFTKESEYTLVNFHMYKYILYNQESDDRNINTAQCIKFYRQATKNRPFNPNSEIFFDPNLARQVAMMGASQIQFQYNYNNNSLFQISYLHTPYYNSGGNEAVSMYYMGSPFNNVFQYVNATTGCFFTNLEPKEFWGDIIGFDLNSLVVKDNPVNHQLNAPLLTGINITGNLITYDLLFNKSDSPLQYQPNSESGDAYVKKADAVSNQTIPIPATKTQGITTSSFYIIELGGLSNINMVNDTDLFRTICAIGSKQYNTQGVISIYPDGTAFFTNNSPIPLYISSFRVRVLDSLTKKASNTLGGRNSIFIELTNPPQAIQQPEEENKKSEKK